MALHATDLTLPKENSPLTEGDVATFVTHANEKGWDKPTAQAYLDERLEATTGYITRSTAARKAEVEKVKAEALKTPDGSPLTEAEKTAVVAFAKKHEVTLAAAQDMLEQMDGGVRGYEQRKLNEHKANHAKWFDEVKADKDLGGIHFDRTLKRVELALAKHDPLKRWVGRLEAIGARNDPETIRYLNSVGADLEEDRTVIGGPGGTRQEKKSAADMLYGKKEPVTA